SSFHSLIFFFFQAQDGIRDSSVTGVQTCALPILVAEALGGADLAHLSVPSAPRVAAVLHEHRRHLRIAEEQLELATAHIAHAERSEERRVGKECRSGWRTEECKKNQNRDGRTRNI